MSVRRTMYPTVGHLRRRSTSLDDARMDVASGCAAGVLFVVRRRGARVGKGT